MRLLALVALLAACAPGRPLNEIVAGPDDASAIVAEFADVDPSITWMSGRCLDIDSDKCFAGLTYDGCEIYVLYRSEARRSSLRHELKHCRSEILFGDLDRDHTRVELAW